MEKTLQVEILKLQEQKLTKPEQKQLLEKI